ncbi:MAG: hypothetical protein CMJ81_01315 [Planctomycetaceae bacterium]|jgi:hypothetical protein|nr:hypothetical protein [Planctomycetaceae bacterium]
MFESILTFVDSGLGFLPELLRVLGWGALTGTVAMLLYARISPQRRIAEVEAQAMAARKELRAYQGVETRMMLSLVRRSLALSLKQVGLTVGPTLLLTPPVLLMFAWMNQAYSYRLPDPQAVVQVTLRASEGAEPVLPALQWEPASAVKRDAAGKTVAVNWPSVTEGETVVLINAVGEQQLLLPLAHPRARVAKSGWWHWLLASPVGYLPAESPLEAVELELPPRTLLSFGPEWMRGWLAAFTTALGTLALAIKIAFGIK